MNPMCEIRALPTETKVESGMSQRKSGASVNLCDSEKRFRWTVSAKALIAAEWVCAEETVHPLTCSGRVLLTVSVSSYESFHSISGGCDFSALS